MIYKSPERRWWHRWWYIVDGHLWYGPFRTRLGAKRCRATVGEPAAAHCPKCKSTDPHVCIPKRATAHRHPHLKWWPPNLEAAPGCCDDPFHSVPAAAPEPHVGFDGSVEMHVLVACPTCGSTDRAVYITGTIENPNRERCEDAWHGGETP